MCKNGLTTMYCSKRIAKQSSGKRSKTRKNTTAIGTLVIPMMKNLAVLPKNSKSLLAGKDLGKGKENLLMVRTERMAKMEGRTEARLVEKRTIAEGCKAQITYLVQDDFKQSILKRFIQKLISFKY